MNILYITKTSLLSDGGGAEERARRVTEGLAEKGHNVKILSGKTDRDLPSKTHLNGCTVQHVKCIPSLLFNWPNLSYYATRYLFAVMSILPLIQILLQDDFDVVVENMTPYPTLSVLLAKIFSVPTVAVQHEFHDESRFKTYDPLTAAIQLIVQNLLRVVRYDAIIVPTQHVMEQLIAYGIPAERLHTIPNGVEAEKYQLDITERDERLLLTVGRINKRKNQETVIRAFSHVRQEFPGLQLAIVGTGPDQARLEQFADDLNVADSITFHGFVSEREKIRLMNKATMFCYSSKQEGFGVVLLEAMAAGLPVVAKQLPVYEEFFEDGTNGSLISKEDPRVFAEEIGHFLKNEELWNEISSRNRSTAAEYSWDATAKQTETVLAATA